MRHFVVFVPIVQLDLNLLRSEATEDLAVDFQAVNCSGNLMQAMMRMRLSLLCCVALKVQLQLRLLLPLHCGFVASLVRKDEFVVDLIALLGAGDEIVLTTIGAATADFG